MSSTSVRPYCSPRHLTWYLLGQGKVAGWFEKHRARTCNRFLSILKTYSRNSHKSSVTFKKNGANRSSGSCLPCFMSYSSGLVMGPNITCRWTIFSHKSKCFWQKYQDAWPFRLQRSSGRAVLTTAVCSARGDEVSRCLNLQSLHQSPVNTTITHGSEHYSLATALRMFGANPYASKMWWLINHIGSFTWKPVEYITLAW
jgi:hypothetical protein